MKLRIASAVASVLLLSMNLPVGAQGLPPTNMGKWVHQPGDNQYNMNTQQERHGNTYIDRTGPGGSVYVQRGAGGGGGGGGGGGPLPGMAPMVVNPMILMGSNKPKVDISLEAISADEPIPPPGFPPLPERLALPVALGGSSGGGNNWNMGGGGGGSRGGGGGGGGSSPVQGVHQHYVHLKPGAFQPDAGGGGGGGGGGGASYQGAGDAAVPGVDQSPIGGANPGSQIVNPGRGVGYYKALPGGPINLPGDRIPGGGGAGGDSFNAGGASAPRYTGASSRDLKRLGKAPGLDDRADQATAPEAPQAAVVTQSTTQDLSLPDDEFVSRYGLQDTAGKKAAKYMGRKTAQFGGRVLNRATGLIGF